MPALNKQFSPEEISAQARGMSDRPALSRAGGSSAVELFLASPDVTADAIRTERLQVLRKLVDDASKFLGDKIEKAVITVPGECSRDRRAKFGKRARLPGLCGASVLLPCDSRFHAKSPGQLPAGFDGAERGVCDAPSHRGQLTN